MYKLDWLDFYFFYLPLAFTALVISPAFLYWSGKFLKIKNHQFTYANSVWISAAVGCVPGISWAVTGRYDIWSPILTLVIAVVLFSFLLWKVFQLKIKTLLALVLLYFIVMPAMVFLMMSLLGVVILSGKPNGQWM